MQIFKKKYLNYKIILIRNFKRMIKKLKNYKTEY